MPNVTGKNGLSVRTGGPVNVVACNDVPNARKPPGKTEFAGVPALAAVPMQEGAPGVAKVTGSTGAPAEARSLIVTEGGG